LSVGGFEALSISGTAACGRGNLWTNEMPKELVTANE
jgi:hypothetical protein